MLEPGERRLFLQTLEPPDGYGLDEGIGTTFTLDLTSLLTAPLAFTMFEWEDEAGKPTSNPVLLLEALRRHASQLTIFCHAGRLIPPVRPNQLFGYLEDSVVEVLPQDREGVFHPKVWVLRFTPVENTEETDLPVFYRLVCQTRNLTGDASWDVSLAMDGELKNRKVGFAANRSLGEFIGQLAGLVVHPLDDSVRERLERISQEIRRVDFELPDDFREYGFWPLGLEGHRRWPFPEDHSRVAVVSPFLSAGALDRIAGDAGDTLLVGRFEELRCLSGEELSPFDQIYVLSDAAATSAMATDGQGTLQGLHAKVYVFERGREASVFIGSANASDAAFSRNVEFLVELTGSRSRCGVDALLGGSEDGDESSLFRMLEAYDPPEEAEPPDPRLNQVDRILEKVRQELATASLIARAKVNGSAVELTLGIPDGILQTPSGLKHVKVWPITLPEHTAKPVESGATLDFGTVGLTGLTPFFAFSATAEVEGLEQESRFVLKLQLEDAPANRKEAILRHVLDNPSKVMRFLQFLLGDEDSLGYTPGDAAPNPPAPLRNSAPDHYTPESLLLEPLLRALRREPDRLDQVAAVVKDLQGEDDAPSALPSGFERIWEPIWRARERLRS